MEYFKSGLKTVLGATEPGDLPTGAETVSKTIIFWNIIFDLFDDTFNKF